MGNSAINEDRLFQNLPYFFSNPIKVTTELIQNAQRSGADSATIEYVDGLLKVTDNGSGTANPAPLLVLADSEWEDIVMNNANPAGFGLFFLFSVAVSVTFRSLFGELTINCSRYLENRGYREAILDEVIQQGKIDEGFEIIAVLKEDVQKHFEVNTEDLSYFPLAISYNGEPIERKHAAAVFKDNKIKTHYHGNEVFIDPTYSLHGYEHRIDSSDDYFEKRLFVVWYGMPIRDRAKYHGDYIAIDVKNGSPLTPQLPYRDKIQRNSLFHEFKEFVRSSIVQYCSAVINTADPEATDRNLVALMKVMSNLATQEELDMLNLFFIKECEQYSDRDSTYKIVRRDNPFVVREELSGIVISTKGYLDTSGDIDIENITMPSGYITRRWTRLNAPSWLTIESKEYVITIVCSDNAYNGNYGWREVLSMTCEDKGELTILAAVESSCDGSIFYKGSPIEFYDISKSVFEKSIYYDDSDADSHYTQEDFFAKDIEADIMVITGQYDIFKLLDGLQRTANIDPSKVASISITLEPHEMVITLTDDKQERLKLS